VHRTQHNPLASEPFYDPIVTFIVDPTTSGFVPVNAVGGRDVERIIFFGGEGPNIIAFPILLQSLFCKNLDLDCSILFIHEPHIKCNTTEKCSSRPFEVFHLLK
jgi:hypothetical protein